MMNDETKTNANDGTQRAESAKAAPHVNVKLLTFLLAACSMIGPFATDMYLPSFHEMICLLYTSDAADEL